MLPPRPALLGSTRTPRYTPAPTVPPGPVGHILFGAVAQLVERVVRNDEVGSSTLLRST